MTRTHKIFFPKEEFDKLERRARSRGMTAQEYVDSAVSKLEEVK